MHTTTTFTFALEKPHISDPSHNAVDIKKSSQEYNYVLLSYLNAKLLNNHSTGSLALVLKLDGGKQKDYYQFCSMCIMYKPQVCIFILKFLMQAMS